MPVHVGMHWHNIIKHCDNANLAKKKENNIEVVNIIHAKFRHEESSIIVDATNNLLLKDVIKSAKQVAILKID